MVGLTPYTLTFTVDELPKLPNRLLTAPWRTVKLHKDRWHTWVMAKVAQKQPQKPLQRAKLTLTRHSALRPDPDGLVGGWKHVIDGLVINRVLAGDTSAHVELDIRWERAPRRKGFITVEIQEL